MLKFFAPCPRGLEPLLAQELAALGAQSVEATQGGVGFSGDGETCWRANLESRLATRILLYLGDAPYAREDDIYRLALGLDWPAWFSPDHTLRVQVTAIRSPLKSLDFITLRIKDAICDRFRETTGARPSVDTRHPDVRVHGFLTRDHCTLYIDTSGNPLWQRGLRQEAVEAPLKENLAAGILMLSGWQPGTPLLDPMCGSGTFLLEAVLMAHDMAPGARRDFAFEKLKGFDSAAWQRLRKSVLGRARPVAFAHIHGSDRNAQAVWMAKQNLEKAGLLDAVKLQQGDLLDIGAPAPAGVMVANPPYGVRIGEQEELAAFYPRLGDTLKKKFAGWNCYFISADTRLPKLLGLKPGRKTPLFNGNLECRLYEFQVRAGSFRKEKPPGS